MSIARPEVDPPLTTAFDATSQKKPNPTLSPVTLRMTAEERAKLEELAAGMTLSA
ncbi:hypothetical protein [uncultured Sulfitobacter sp.]|uniref:hypothetical protein n=1 Tax=uncultured Sulfitobacter sp. TaxID=191468 RepID=UPI00261015E9|nr:hypothetical protein [uncultured Sulfitobacter sp.]